MPGLIDAATTVLAVTTLLSIVVVSLRQQWMRVVMRLAGSWIAAVALLMLG
ncbi:MAG TPA: hypothetical protein VIG57_22015 [Candidatus Entotheonella sp.]